MNYDAIKQVAAELNDRIADLCSKQGAEAYLIAQRNKAQEFLAEQPMKIMAEGKSSLRHASMREVIEIQMRYIEAHPDLVIEKEIHRLAEQEFRLRDLYPEAFEASQGGHV